MKVLEMNCFNCGWNKNLLAHLGVEPDCNCDDNFECTPENRASWKGCCPLCGQKVKDLRYYRKQCNRQLSGVVELIKAVEKETKNNRP